MNATLVTWRSNDDYRAEISQLSIILGAGRKGKTPCVIVLAGPRDAEKVEEGAVMRKVDRHVLTHFVGLTLLCYLVRVSYVS